MHTESVLRELIEDRKHKLASEMTKIPVGASDPPEEMLTAIFELDALQDELREVRENGPGFGESPVRVPPEPPLHPNSGAIALPAPDEEQTINLRGKSHKGRFCDASALRRRAQKIAILLKGTVW